MKHVEKIPRTDSLNICSCVVHVRPTVLMDFFTIFESSAQRSYETASEWWVTSHGWNIQAFFCVCVCKSSRRSLDTESFVWMAWGLHNLIYCELRHHHQSCFSIPAAASAAACENPEDHSSGWDRNADILWLSSRMLFFPEQCLHLVTVWFLYCVVVYVLLSLLGIRFKVLVDTHGASQASLLTFKIGQVGFSCFAVKYHKTLRCKHKVYTKRHLQSILNPLQAMNNQIIE